jgi:hypothetical protein
MFWTNAVVDIAGIGFALAIKVVTQGKTFTNSFPEQVTSYS